jgi:CRISPR-associated protein Cst1
MLKLTGHPLIDIGAATIAAFAHKIRIEDVTVDDFEVITRYMEREYVSQPLKSFLTVPFTSNAWFSQDAYNPDKPDLTAEERSQRRSTRDRLSRAHLRAWQDAPSLDERCVFTG